MNSQRLSHSHVAALNPRQQALDKLFFPFRTCTSSATRIGLRQGRHLRIFDRTLRDGG